MSPRSHPRPGVIRVLPGQPYLEFDIGWALINHEQLKRFATDLRRRRWDLLILDEGQALKEPERARTILVHGGVWADKAYPPIPTRKALVISGTPLKNRLEELFTLLNFLDPDNWPDRGRFIDQHYEETTGNGEPRIVTSEGRVVQNVAPRNLEALHRRLKETVLVRTHKDDVPGLPAKRFEKISVPLNNEADRRWFDEHSHTAQKISRLLRRAQHSHDIDTAQELERRLKQIRSLIAQHSSRAKRQAVLDYLLDIPPEHKVVVIGFHRDLFLTQLANALRQKGRLVVEHNGDNSARAEETVDAFQTKPEIQFFIGQLNVSNLSLTLTAASHVVFCEIPTTHADFEQALDRVHRFGQVASAVTATVFALDWPTAGDENLLKALLHWKDVSDITLDGRRDGSSWTWTTPEDRSDPRWGRWEARVRQRARRLARDLIRSTVRTAQPGGFATEEVTIDGGADWEQIEFVLNSTGFIDEFERIRAQAYSEVEMPSPRHSIAVPDDLSELRQCVRHKRLVGFK